MDLTLFDYWRSSACYRVRIALNLKALPYSARSVHLVRDGGEQHGAAHRAINPAEAVPVLMHDGRIVRQSLAIMEYLDEIAPATPLIPPDAASRADVRALSLLIACDVHPLNNLRVMRYLEREFGAQPPARDAWMRHWMADGLRAFEALLIEAGSNGRFCHGDTATFADACLIPQVYNGFRFGLDMSAFPTVLGINAHCLSLPAFDAARPERQADAP